LEILFITKYPITDKKELTVSININQKERLITNKDAQILRIKKVNKIISALNDYIKLPDIDREEKMSILCLVKDLRNQIESLNNYLKN
jgi:hypothetical protein